MNSASINVRFWGQSRHRADMGQMSAHSLPEPIIGYARAAMRRLLSSATFANNSALLTPSVSDSLPSNSAPVKCTRQMTDRLEGIHALITGAASGIGAACARRMVRDGAQLLLADLNGDGAKTLADELRQASVQADVTRTDDIQRMLDLAYQRWGRLDVLFNNAGIAEVRQLLELTEDEWDRTLAVNLRAVFFVLQGAAKRMRHQSPITGSELRGKLIQTASIAAYRGGQAYMVHYAASKAGVVSITRTAAQVLATDRITSNCVCPGAVDTPMWRKIDAEWTEIEGW